MLSKKIRVTLISSAIGLMIPVTSFANTDLEKQDLYRVLKEIKLMETLIVSAESHAVKGARLQVRYQDIRSDLKKFKSGVLERFKFEEIQPKKVDPIDGDYLQFKGK